jgi:hypothetical protein
MDAWAGTLSHPINWNIGTQAVIQARASGE